MKKHFLVSSPGYDWFYRGIRNLAKGNFGAVLAIPCLCLFSLVARGQQMPALNAVRPAPAAVSGYVPGRILVKFKEGIRPTFSKGQDGVHVNVAAIDELNRNNKCTGFKRLYVGKTNRNTNFSYTLDFPAGTNVEKLVEAYRSSGAFEVVSADYLVGVTTTTPNDANFGYSWGMYNTGTYIFSGVTSVAGRDIDMRLAWDLTQGSSAITVAVIDAGIKLDHPEFSGRIWTKSSEIAGNGVDDDGNGYIDDTQGWDWVNDDNNPTDDQGHGTNVAGIIGATGNNSIGYAGMDWNCKLMALKTQGTSGTGSTSDIIQAVYYATDEGAEVINMSLGGSTSVSLFQDAINYAYSNKVVVVAAMGNSNTSTPSYPAAYNHVIAVGATRCDDRRASFSNFGSHISVVAPGEAIFGLSYLSNTDYSGGMSGTSQATPHVAGLASLMLALDPSKTPDQIKAIIEATAEDQVGLSTEDVAGFDNYHGHGRINAYQALLYCTTPNAITGTASACVGSTTTLATSTTGGSWSSSNTAVASITSGGVVTAVAAGLATITYKKLSCYTTVSFLVKPVPTLSVSPTSASICLGNNTAVLASSTAGGVTLLSENWNSGYLNGWTTSCSDPVGFSCWQIRNSPGYSGTVTGDGSAYMQAAPDAAASTTTRLVSPSFSTVGYSSATLTYNQHFTSWSGDVTVAVEYSTNGGTTWTTLINQLGSSVPGTSWTAATPQITFSLPAGALGQSNVKIRWNYVSNNGYYWAIDNIAVKGTSSVTYSWNGVGGASGLSCSTCSSPTITPTATGANVYSVTATANGCSATSGITVNTSSGAPSAIGGTATVCVGSNTTLTNSVTGGSWISTNTSVATIGSSNGVVIGVASGTVVISYGSICGFVTKIVTVNPLPNAGTITGTASVCTGNTTTLSNAVSGGSWISSAPGVATVSGGVVSGVASGTATISYMVFNSCGSATATRIVTVNASPNAGSITGPTTVCTGNTITLSNSVTGGTWSSGATAVATITTTGVVTGVSTGSTVISYTTVNGCGSATATSMVFVNPSPNAGTITGTASVCTGNTTTLSNTASGGAWTSGTTSVATVSGGVVSGVAAGTAVISYTVTNSCGTANAIKIVTVNASPTVGTITGPTTVCTGNTITLSNSVTGGTWSSSASAVASITSTGVVTGVSSGSAVISYTRTNGCGSVTATSTVFVNPSPNAGTITGTASVCTGNTTTLSNTASGGVWSSGSTSVATVTAGVVSGVAAGTSVISYTVTNSCGTANATKIVTVNAAPTVGTITGPTTVCTGNTITLSNSVTGGTWSSSATAIFTITTTSVVTGVSMGSAVVSYTRANGCGSVTATSMVYVSPLPDAGTIYGTASLCVGETTMLTDSAFGGAWTSGTAAVATVGSTGLVTGVTSGTARISYTISGTCGTAVATRIVTVNPAPNAGTITGSSAVAVGSSISLSNTSSGGTWSVDSTGVATVSSSGVVTGLSGGTVVISYTVTNSCGTAVSTKTITVNEIVDADISGDLTVCAGSTTTLTASEAEGTWSSSNTARATVSSTGVVTGVSAGTVVISYNVSGGVVTVVVTVNASPTIGGSASICVGTAATLSATAGGAWTSLDSEVAAVGSTGIVTGMSYGTATIEYTLSNGCKTSTVATVNVTPTPIEGLASVCIGASITLSNSSSGGTWSSSNASVATIDASGEVTGSATGTTLISYSFGSCRVTRAVTVLAVPATIGGVAKACPGTTTTLSNAIAGGSWSISDPGIATINSAGVISGIAAGTVEVAYTLSNGCAKFADVTVNPNPTDITGTLSLCQAATTTLADSTPVLMSWTSSDPTKATVSSSGVVSGIAVGTSTITYKVTTGCYTTAMVTVSAVPPGITGITTACPGATTTLNNTLVGGVWSSNDSTVATVGGSTGIVTGVSTGTTIISYTNAAGCSKSVIVTINAVPTISGAGTVCVGKTTNLTCSPGATSWASGSTTIATVSGGIVTGVSGGMAIITATAATGCKATTTVTVNALPPTISGTQSVCVGSMTSLSNTASGGTWAVSAPGKATIDSSGMVTGVAAGTTVVSYTSVEGCVRTGVVTVNALPNITGTASVCIGNVVTLTGTAGGGTWASLDAGIATVGATGIVTGVSSGTATIDYTLSNGCKKTAIATVNAAPGAISGTASVCIGSTTMLTNSMPGGAWSSSNAAVGTIGTAGNVTGIASGTTVVSYSFGTCRATRIVTVLAVPAAIGGVAKACVGTTSLVNNATAGGAWSSSDPAIATINSSGLITGIVAGTVDIIYTMPNTCSKSIVATINPNPAGITGSLTLCQPGTTALASATPGMLSWTSSDPTKAIVNSAGVVTAIAAGTSTITYKLTTGCYTTAMVTVNTVPPISGIAAICETATTTLSNAATGTWSSADPSIATVGLTTGVVTGVAAGSVAIVFNATNGCTATKAMTIATCGSRGVATTGAATTELNTQIAIFPNPTSGMLTINTPETGSLSVLALDGKEVARFDLAKGNTNVVLPQDLAAGVYVCRVITSNGDVTTIRLIYEAK